MFSENLDEMKVVLRSVTGMQKQSFTIFFITLYLLVLTINMVEITFLNYFFADLLMVNLVALSCQWTRCPVHEVANNFIHFLNFYH